ncbi:MAG: hypothetical protein ACOYOK_11505, partial [Pseudobdellovibrionaceae bacterium]
HQKSRKTSVCPDKLIDKIETKVNFYTSNQHLLWKPFLNLCLIFKWVGMVVSLGSIVSIDFQDLEWSNFYILQSGKLLLFAIFLFFANIFLISLTKRKLRQEKSQGVTLFAVFLLINLMQFNLIVFIFGLYPLFNSRFQRHAAEWLPEWYKKINVLGWDEEDELSPGLSSGIKKESTDNPENKSND